MNRYLILLIALGIAFPSQAVKESKFCEYVLEEDFKKVEKLIEKKIHDLRFGSLEYNSSTSYTTFNNEIDSICKWLRSKDCVIDAFWDKCATKIAIYPGHSNFAAKFRLKKGTIEKCFRVQEGKINSLNRHFGWIKQFPDKNELFYEGMTDCTGFIDEQKGYCREMGMEFLADTSYMFLEGHWQSADREETIVFQFDSHGDASYFVSRSVYSDSLTLFKDRVYQFMLNDLENPHELKGLFLAWGGHSCILKIRSRNIISIKYPESLGGTIHYFKVAPKKEE